MITGSPMSEPREAAEINSNHATSDDELDEEEPDFKLGFQKASLAKLEDYSKLEKAVSCESYYTQLKAQPFLLSSPEGRRQNLLLWENGPISTVLILQKELTSSTKHYEP